MAGTESLKREQVKAAYSGDAWKARVRNMSDNQIIAIWNRLKNSNKI